MSVIDLDGERRDRKALNAIRGQLLARGGELLASIANPQGADIGEDLIAWNEHVCAMFRLIDEAAKIRDGDAQRNHG